MEIDSNLFKDCPLSKQQYIDLILHVSSIVCQFNAYNTFVDQDHTCLYLFVGVFSMGDTYTEAVWMGYRYYTRSGVQGHQQYCHYPYICHRIQNKVWPKNLDASTFTMYHLLCLLN